MTLLEVDLGRKASKKNKRPLDYTKIPSRPKYDPDGYPIGDGSGLIEMLTGTVEELDKLGLDALRDESWRQYKTSPFIQPSVHDARDSLCGHNFEVTSPNSAIKKVIDGFWYHPLNEINKRIKQFVLTKKVTGELFLILTINKQAGLVEVDMVPPERITGIGDNNCGILFHSRKTRLPLVYNIRFDNGDEEHVPSTKVAYSPDLIKDLYNEESESKGFDKAKLKASKGDGIGGFKRFMVEWEGPCLAQRSTSYLRSVLVWNNFFTILKLAEIDHKRAMSAFCYAIKPETLEAWEAWVELPYEKKLETGLLTEKKSGSTIELPFGYDMKILCPQLPSLTGNDNDLIELLSGGLNTARDSMTGSSVETYAGVKLSRGNISDRVKADQEEFERFCKFDLLQPILFIYVNLFGLPNSFTNRECIGYEHASDEGKPKPIFDDVQRKVHIGGDIRKLITISMPIMTLEPVESQTKAWLGTKPAGADESLGISKKTIAEKLGISDYHAERMARDTEEACYPPLVSEGATNEHQ